MHKQFFFLSPVEVVKVTSQNLEEAAEWCGGSVQETKSRLVKGRMDKYVLVPTPSEKNISSAFPGMFITKRVVINMKDELRTTFAVFRRDYFDKNYFDTPKEATDKTWERAESEKARKPKNPEVEVNVNVGQKLLEAQAKINELQKEKEEARQKTADILMSRKSDLELVVLKNEGHITDDDIRRHKGDQPMDSAKPVATFIHAHKLDEPCDTGCCVHRYVDGIHIFSDQVVHADPHGWRVEELEGKSEAEVERAVNG